MTEMLVGVLVAVPIALLIVMALASYLDDEDDGF